jgi:integrase
MSPSLGKSASHLFLRGTKFYYRKVLPPDLYDIIGIKEIKISLGTSNIKEARLLSAFLEVNTAQLLKFLRGGYQVQYFSDEQIMEIVAQWIRNKKKELEKLRAFDMNDFVFQIDGDTGEKIDTTMEDRIGALQQVVDLEQAKLSGEICADNWIESIAEKLAKENGIPLPPKNNPVCEEAVPYRLLCRELRKAFVALGNAETKRMQGIYERYGNLVNDEENAFIEQIIHGNPAITANSKKRNKRLSDLLEDYLSSMEDKGNVGKTIKSTKDICGLFLEIIGDPFLDEMESSMVSKYLKTLKKLPANRSKKKKYRKKSIDDLLKMNIKKDDLMHVTTVRNHISKVKSFFIWIEKRQYFAKDEYSGLFVQEKDFVPPEEKRDLFTPSDLTKIFSHDDYVSFNRPSKFWAPLIALFTGMRVSEITLLRLDDIKKDGEIWYFDVVRDADDNKRTKTLSSIRKIPVHQQLIDIGLLKYVQQLRIHSKKYLFQDVVDKTQNPSDAVGDAFNRWVKKIQVEGSEEKGKKTFHSFRHTFLTRCDRLGLREDWTERIAGHENNNQIRRAYVKPVEVPLLYDEIISKLYYDVDLTHLENYMKESRYDPWGEKKKAKKISGK